MIDEIVNKKLTFYNFFSNSQGNENISEKFLYSVENSKLSKNISEPI